MCFDIEGKGGMTEDTSVDGRQYYFSFDDVQVVSPDMYFSSSASAFDRFGRFSQLFSY